MAVLLEHERDWVMNTAEMAVLRVSADCLFTRFETQWHALCGVFLEQMLYGRDMQDRILQLYPEVGHSVARQLTEAVTERVLEETRFYLRLQYLECVASDERSPT